MLDVVLESLLDTLKLLPVLLLVYILISYLTHHKEEPYKYLTKKGKKFGPLIGSFLGIIPQCGFSVVMADLFSKRAITLGTLFSVFLATSDEAIPILLTYPSLYDKLFIILFVKLLIGIIFGYLIDFILIMLEKNKKLKIITNENILNLHSNIKTINVEHTHETHCLCSSHNKNSDHEDSCCSDNIFMDAIIHTLKITSFIFIVNLVLNIIIYYVGMENFISFVSINKFLQPLVTSLIGLIPNCVASVFLIELYMAGGITLAATIAGLSIGSGVGIIILFKNNKNIIQNIIIAVSLYIISVLVGLLLTPILG